VSEQGRGVSDRFAVGDAAWRTHQFTAADFAAFAEATGDRNPLHHDDTYAVETDFGRTVVPLAMVVGPVSGLVGTVIPGPGAVILSATYRPLEPVHYNEAIAYSVRVAAVSAATDSLTLRVIAVQAGRIMLEADVEVTAATPEPPSGTAPCGTFEPAGRRRLAVVTGVPGAIGSATARCLAAAGWDLAVVHRGGEERVRALIDDCRAAGAEIESLGADLAETADRARLAEWIREAAPALLVHAASPPPTSARGPQFDVGYGALRDLTEAAIPGMLRRQEGAVVFLGSAAERYHVPGLADYDAAKSAAASVLRSVRARFRRYGVRTLIIAPGYVDGSFSADLRPRDAVALAPEEIAEAIVRELRGPADDVFTVYLEPGRTERVGDRGAAVIPVPAAQTKGDAATNAAAAAGPATTDSVRSRAERSIRAVLDLPAGASLRGGGLGLTEGWDSLRQIQIVVALESEFGVRLRSADLAEARRFEELCDAVAARLEERG